MDNGINTIYTYHVAYALKHNLREVQGLNDQFGQMIRSTYDDYEPNGSTDNVISVCEQAGTKFFDF